MAKDSKAPSINLAFNRYLPDFHYPAIQPQAEEAGSTRQELAGYSRLFCLFNSRHPSLIMVSSTTTVHTKRKTAPHYLGDADGALTC